MELFKTLNLKSQNIEAKNTAELINVLRQHIKNGGNEQTIRSNSSTKATTEMIHEPGGILIQNLLIEEHRNS